jgi:hypothetical protein
MIEPVDKKEKRKLKKSKKIFSFIRNALSDSTIHGLPNLLKSERIIFKFMWFIFFTTSLIFGVYSIYTNTIDYLSYDVVTQIQINYESPTIFPTITFYNLNYFSPDFTAKFSLKDILIKCDFNGVSCFYYQFEEKTDKLGYVYYQFNTGN